MLYQLSYECDAKIRKKGLSAKNYFEIFKALNSLKYAPYLTKNECFIKSENNMKRVQTVYNGGVNL
jgi:hypothetical protein